MVEIPDELAARKDGYCTRCGFVAADIRGYGVDAAIWQTSADTIVKVFRRIGPFEAERAVYHRLTSRGLYRLAGFAIPVLLHSDPDFLVIEMTIVEPPYILDFAAAALDKAPAGFDLSEARWRAEKAGLFGASWPDVQRLLDALLQYGIHYTDVHAQNIRV